ncbi:MAG: 3-(cis-5,6-dihydroxycyclohexa-1,3-dien-1-yl)propanoate dehydrogenase [Oceanospirillales bacterium]|nr:3-(cis-5,6-dihydroxycyclohexa-1,3-dien-1-yl)propanoate dehydrogenase [Oceanospirillales bacterium]MBR9888174.1 3-(cis-5,6-dihydroxycyclohexa-1,3-dien-1-yl)propanoate dehydrogenase [Oceanospirillales bacterium]
MTTLKDKVAFVSGGADGIGRAVVERFISEGAKVAVLDLNQEKLDALQALYPEDLCHVCGDVTDYDNNQKIVDLAVERFGKLDVFVGNAALFDFFAPLSRIAPEKLEASFNKLFQVNVLGYMNGVKAAMEQLKQNRGGVVLTVSNSGFYPGGGGVLYVTSKHAVVGLIKQLAYELAPEIRVNGVSPGATDTEMKSVEGISSKSRPLNQIPNFNENAANAVPLKRIARPEDHASLYVLLASNEQSPMTTGTVIHSDGGWIAR